MIRKLASLAMVGATAFLMDGCPGSSADCRSEDDCPLGRYCQAGSCVYDCTFDTDCPSAYRCTTSGRCERGCVETNGGVEACDGADNDCDDRTDEDFVDLGLACDLGCGPGQYTCRSDGSDVYCDAVAPAASDPTCDGLDEDCDGFTDEDALEQACPLQAGVCAGATHGCQDGSWTACDYGSNHQATDASCDGLDNDCDGQTDEEAEPLLLPEAGGLAADGQDNNCNGLVDEAGGVMLRILNYQTWIDAYEMVVSSDPNCQGGFYGQNANDYPADWPPGATPGTLTLYACSLPNVIPSGHLTWYQAQRACQAQGKQLCSEQHYEMACQNDGGMYPYGPNFTPGACNDALGGTGQVEPTGSFPQCRSRVGAYDLSGNLAEWTAMLDTTYDGNAIVGGFGFDCSFCAWGDYCYPCDPDDPDDVHMLQNISDCALSLGNLISFHRNQVKAFIGARCCLSVP